MLHTPVATSPVYRIGSLTGTGFDNGVINAADTTLDAGEKVTLRVNLMGVVHGCHYFVPAMVERGHGHVVNISSVLGYHGAPRVVAYQASKFAVLGLTLSMRAELASTGVHATAICPGMIATAIIDRTRFAGASGTVEKMLPDFLPGARLDNAGKIKRKQA